MNVHNLFTQFLFVAIKKKPNPGRITSFSLIYSVEKYEDDVIKSVQTK